VSWYTCGGGAQDYWRISGDSEIPDPVPVAHILLKQLTHGSGPRGGFKAGHNLNREGRRRHKRGTEREAFNSYQHGTHVPIGLRIKIMIMQLKAP